MKPVRGWIRAGLAVLAALAGSGMAYPAEPVVSAYYYPWYGADGRHWDLGYAGRDTGQGPALGRYDSRAEETIRRHIAWSAEFGIDNWIASWWGPGSWEDETLLRHVLPALGKMAAAGQPAPTLCLLYESEGLLGLDPERGIEFNEEKIRAFSDHFRHLAEHYFAHPSYQRVGGRPVVYLYLSRTYTGDFARALATARAVAEARGFRVYLIGDEIYWGEPDARRIGYLDAITAYNLHGPTEWAGLEDWTGFVEACGAVHVRYRDVATPLGTAIVPGLIPGFDTGGRHYTIPRVLKPGAGPDSLLEAMAAMAARHIDERLGHVAITSFNEWHEGTQVEPDGGGGAILRRWFKPRR